VARWATGAASSAPTTTDDERADGFLDSGFGSARNGDRAAGGPSFVAHDTLWEGDFRITAESCRTWKQVVVVDRGDRTLRSQEALDFGGDGVAEFLVLIGLEVDPVDLA